MGLLEDLMNDPVIREGISQKELESAGSVMARKPYKPGPLGVGGDVIRQLLEVINPMEWMGGPGQAI